jgi:carboxymethylenebutenolidase
MRLAVFSLRALLVSVIVAGFLSLGSATAVAQRDDWAKARLESSRRHLEYVDVKYGDRTVKCFIGFPETSEKAQAVIVIHEIFGLADWIRSVVDQLAEAGYIAIAPDLLSGMGPGGGGTEALGGPDGARRVIGQLPPAQVTADLDAVAEYVGKLPAANGNVSVCGFCWGGGQTFRYATNNKNIKAAFVFYGNYGHTAAEIARINCPVYGFYGGRDMRVNASIPQSTELMKAAGKTYEPVTYEGAGHGFLRSGEDPNGPAADKKARDEAWARWKELLAKTAKPAT